MGDDPLNWRSSDGQVPCSSRDRDEFLSLDFSKMNNNSVTSSVPVSGIPLPWNIMLYYSCIILPVLTLSLPIPL